MTGIIKSYSYKHRYGFVTSDNQDYFFNYQDILDSPRKYKQGKTVNFFPINSEKGLRATSVATV